MAGEADAILLTVLAVLFPPAAVAFVAGCGVDLCFNILLTMLGYLPGCLHAFWIVYKRTQANERYGYGNWTYKGMGEYNALNASQQQQQQQQQRGIRQMFVQPRGPEAAPPPPGPPPPSSGTAAAPAVEYEKSPVDQKQSQLYTQPLPPSAPEEKKYEYQAPPQMAPTGGDEKQADKGTAPGTSGT